MGSQEGKIGNIQKKARFYNSSSLASPTPTTNQLHCNGNPIYVFSEKELRGLSPNFNIHVSVNELYISRMEYINCSQKTAQFLFWEYMFQIFSTLSLQCRLLQLIHLSRVLAGRPAGRTDASAPLSAAAASPPPPCTINLLGVYNFSSALKTSASGKYLYQCAGTRKIWLYFQQCSALKWQQYWNACHIELQENGNLNGLYWEHQQSAWKISLSVCWNIPTVQ
jgi:hypothetical protein